MEFFLLGGGLAAATMAAWALWYAIRKHHAKLEKEAKRTASLEKRRAKKAAANPLAGMNGTTQADLMDKYNKQSGLGREMYGRGEHQ